MNLPKHAERWLPGLLRDRIGRRVHPAPVITHYWVTIADHFEPGWQLADEPTARARVARWASEWPRIAGRHHDSLGRPATYTFFFPEEEYRPALIAPLAEMTRAGIADVEVHIHHDGEGEDDFMQRMSTFIRALRDEHGLLREIDGRTGFGFIHGNWALDNSHPSGRWCGLNNELTLLRALGCYADFTLPAAPDPCQTRRVNSIYWAVDDPARPRSHDNGIPVVPGGIPPASALLMIQGPLGIRWPRERRPWPALEVGELAGNDPVTPGRVRAWLDWAPSVGGHRFVKLHAHGAPEKNAEPLLGRDLDAAFGLLRQETAARGAQVIHATAWQMANAIGEIEAGRDPLRSLM